jgi:hypothetical protein
MIYLPRDKIYLLTGLLGAVGIIAIAYGFEYKAAKASEAVLSTYFKVWSWAFLLCLAGIARGTALSRTEAATSLELPDWVASVLTAITLASSVYFWLPTRHAVPVAIAIIAACASFHWLRRDRLCTAFLLLAGFGLCCYLVATVPIDRSGADMLPIIADADHFLLAGHNPYAQTYSNWFYYLPVQWLVFLPLTAAGVDLRLLNLACFAVVGCLSLWLIRSGRLDKIALLGLCPIILSRSSMEMVLRGQVWPLWALLVGFAATLLSPGRLWPAFLLGILLGTQQPTVAIAALTGTWLLFHRGVASAWRVAVIATGVFALIITPWMILRPSLLVDLYIHIQQTLTPDQAIGQHRGPGQVSILDLLQSMDLTSIRRALQAGAVATGMLYLAFARNVRLGTFLCTVGLVYLVAISLNVQVFKYYYYPGFLLLAIGIAVPANRVDIGRTGVRSG